MFLDVGSFKDFLVLLDASAQFQSTQLGTKIKIHVELDTEDGMGAILTDPQTVKRSLGSPGERMACVNDIFPIVRISVTVNLPFPHGRLDEEDRLHRDVKCVRYETWVSASSQFPIGRTYEFGLVADFRKKLEDEQRRLGFEIVFLSDRPKRWFRETPKPIVN